MQRVPRNYQKRAENRQNMTHFGQYLGAFAGQGSENAGLESIMQVPELKMQVLGSNNAGPRGDTAGPWR